MVFTYKDFVGSGGSGLSIHHCILDLSWASHLSLGMLLDMLLVFCLLLLITSSSMSCFGVFFSLLCVFYC